MSEDGEGELPEVVVVTMRSEPKPQIATYHLLNVLSELTATSLITVTLAEESPIHGEYEVGEIAAGSKAGGLLGTMWLFLGNQIRLCRGLHESDAQVAYFFGGTAYVLPILFAKLVGKTVVVQPRGDVPLTLGLEWRERYPDVGARFLANLVRALEYAGYAVADRIPTYTESMAETIVPGRFRRKVYPKGTRYIDVEAFEPTTPYDDRENRLGMIGRLDVEKGIDELVGAIQRLPDDVAFRFVGDGDRREWIERELDEDIESGRVDVTGWVDHDEIPGHLNDIRLLVLPSEPTEGLPTAIQEAFACGTPVYATPVSGISDVVREGETGFLMENRDPEGIAADVEAILDHENLPEISDNCRAFCVENYSYEASVERFRELLADL